MENRLMPEYPENWDLLLEQLEADLQTGKQLTDAERQILSELRQIRSEAAEALKLYDSFDTDKKLAELRRTLGEDDNLHLKKTGRSVNIWSRIAVAASLLLVIGTGLFYYYQRTDAVTVVYKNDVRAGGNKAILTLANGKKIILTDTLNEELIKQAGVRVTKTKDGRLVYAVMSDHQNGAVEYNTSETPKGGQYQLELADGTKVWLNAASSLRYPTRFTGKDRLVELTGEAYFEVAKNKQHPFIVKTAQQSVEVLGTHFNVNSYTDEPVVNTILLEGSVKINNRVMLKPGEQANLYKTGNLIVSPANQDGIAWKDGNFVFERENIESIMRKVARWYNVEIVYSGERTKELYSGITKRSGHVSQILSMLEKTGTVKFNIEGNKIIVSKTN